MEAVAQAVVDGTISAARLEQSLGRIARLKQRFLAPYKPVVVSDAKLIVGCRTHRALLRSIDQAGERFARAGV
jgi:beta-N-acetylhexosaminidase